jgi:2-haloacid dehalogenase
MPDVAGPEQEAPADAGVFVVTQDIPVPAASLPTGLVFDVGRVIVRWDLRCLFARLIDDGEELDWFLANVVTEEWHFQHDRGRALADMVPERIALFPDYEPHIRAYAARFNETVPGPVPGTIELIEKLAAQDWPLFAITNFGDEFWHGFRPEWPVFDLFRDIVVSGTEKLAKPDPAIFHLAAARFGLPPEELFFIDDNRANIEAAAALGWQVHRFSTCALLEQDLRQRGILA